MPLFRLRKHQSSFSDEDILINPNDYNGLKLFDVVEIKSPKNSGANNSNSRILLQVRKWPDPLNLPNCVSIKDTIINAGPLKLLFEVFINIVDKKDVLIDSIEICFGNAYLARSYMWGLRNHLNNRCVYQKQKLDYLQIRSAICEIWAHGNKVTSGFIDDGTKIVFRSASSLVYLFIQMSSEMWDYDINGDLYCEKTINGFLTDLFDTWRKNECSHDITIILFSRTFYDADSLDEFPKEMRECLQVDNKNRFYEDCYRVAFQNDRFDLHDWNVKLTILKSLFNQYQKEVIDRHQDKYDTKIPRAYNSNASQGNFLEVLNMSLNVFEKHYFDRSFDRTGQLSVVVSPGVGVFEVDFELTNLTKQRIIDNGIGSDLVCLGEQPLHTVPLLKLRSKSSHSDDNLATGDVYNMPHWINLSFYSSQNQDYYSNFVPRIKLPTIHTKLNKDFSKSNLVESARSIRQGESEPTVNLEESCKPTSATTSAKPPATGHSVLNHMTTANNPNRQNINSHSTTMPDLVDYDDYDAQVFKPNPFMNYRYQHQSSKTDRSILVDLDSNADYCINDSEDDFLDRDGPSKLVAGVQRRSSDVKNFQEYSRNIKRRELSDNLPICPSRASPQAQSIFARMSLMDSYLADVKVKPGSADDLSVRGYNVQSSRINRSNGRPKALINPFDPSHMTIKLTPNRRRWTHVFPQGPTGTFIQQHHYQPVVQKGTPADSVEVDSLPVPENEKLNSQVARSSSNTSNKRSAIPTTSGQQTGKSVLTNLAKKWSDSLTSSIGLSNDKSALVSNETIRFAWCASGEQEWTPAITTGVDWKSLTMPACLPLTTDFFPSKTSLQNDYVIGEYNIDSVYIHSRYTLIEVYRELVCQRLQKGFQIILLPRKATAKAHSEKNSPASSSINRSSSSMKRQKANQQSSSEYECETERTEYTMSIGRIFHKLSLTGNTITVTQYRPRHPYPNIKIDYCYRFRAPFHENYGQSWVHFRAEKLEEYNWNYLDHYICNGGELQLRSNMNFWRFRILIVPSYLSLRKISRESSHSGRHDVYHLEFSREERTALMGSFMKLLEIINKTRRASASRLSSSSVPSLSTSSSSSSQSQGQAANSSKQTTYSTLSNDSSAPSTRLMVHINSNQDIDGQPSSQSSESDPEKELRFESITMDIDTALRDAKRAEWVHVQYHNFYDINQAFELVIKWMVASGAGIAEMVQGWSRKAGNSSVHLIPCPWEPFAFPHSGKADPLRCPIAIKLHLDCLSSQTRALDDNQVIMLQEKMLLRYGFIRFHDLISTENIDRQYVHISGFAFVALPNIVNDEEAAAAALTQSKAPSKASSPSAEQPVMLTSSSNRRGSSRLNFLQTKTKGPVVMRQLEHQETVSSPHEEYITRHISGARKNYTSRLRGENEQIEFIWSWNYMLTKRWRSHSTQDESYAVSLMQDFKDFCQNGSNRLVEFWEEVGETL